MNGGRKRESRRGREWSVVSLASGPWAGWTGRFQRPTDWASNNESNDGKQGTLTGSAAPVVGISCCSSERAPWRLGRTGPHRTVDERPQRRPEGNVLLGHLGWMLVYIRIGRWWKLTGCAASCHVQAAARAMPGSGQVQAPGSRTANQQKDWLTLLGTVGNWPLGTRR